MPRAALDDEQRDSVEQGIRDLVEEIGTRPADVRVLFLTIPKSGVYRKPRPPVQRVYCLPAREAQRDKVAGSMIARWLEDKGMVAYNAPTKLAAGELIKLIDSVNADAVGVTRGGAFPIIHARYLCAKFCA